MERAVVLHLDLEAPHVRLYSIYLNFIQEHQGKHTISSYASTIAVKSETESRSFTNKVQLIKNGQVIDEIRFDQVVPKFVARV